jgi:hypothetical protein
MLLWYFLTEKNPKLPCQNAIACLVSSHAYPAYTIYIISTIHVQLFALVKL